MDLFVVPTLSFRLLYGLLVLSNGRRQILRLGVTAHPTANGLPGRLGTNAEVHRPRLRLGLWKFSPAASRHGHSRPANCTTLAHGRMDMRNG